MKTTLSDWFKVLILLLDEAIVIAVVLFLLHWFGVEIPLVLMIVIAVLAGIFVFIIHVKVIPSFHRKQVTGREGIIGLQGTVLQSLTPLGTVHIEGENWKARSDGDYIEAGGNVEVTGIKGLELTVKQVKRE